MKIENKSVLEINSLESTTSLIGTSIDYLLIKKELKEDFEKHEFRICVLPMLKQCGKILYFLLLIIVNFSCKPTPCDKIDKKFRPHKVRHVNKSKIYYYHHNTPCDCDGISLDLCLDCHYQKTYINYVEYYDNGERVWGK